MPKRTSTRRSPVLTRSKRDPVRDYLPFPKWYNLTLKKVEKKSKYISNTQCFGIDGKFYYVHIDPYQNEELNKMTPVLENPDELEDGCYTYVIVSMKMSETPILYLTKVLTLFEFGTKHQQLLRKVLKINSVNNAKYVLYYAGEIRKSGDVIKFNFFSGTYKMKYRISKKELPTAASFTSNLINRITGNKYKTEFETDPLIDKDSLKLTYKDLDDLRSIGAQISQFDNERTCIRYSHALIGKKNIYNRKIDPEYEIYRDQMIADIFKQSKPYESAPNGGRRTRRIRSNKK